MFHSKPFNPFEEASLPKAFYHPSLEKDILEKQSGICLSSNDKVPKGSERVKSKKDLLFIRKSNKFSSHEVPTHEDGTMHQDSSGSQFDESWPSTDKNVSSLSTNISPGCNAVVTDSTTKNDHKVASTLSKYVERFRHGAPASRDDRNSANSKDFWWLSPPSNSSTPKETTCGTSSALSSDISPKKTRVVSKKRSVAHSRPLRDIVEEQEKDNLQTRTEWLLEQSEHTLSGVSTPESLPKPPSSWMIEKLKRREPLEETKRATQLAPEDDILYQWRLARKLERAQEQAKSDQLKTVGKFVKAADITSIYCGKNDNIACQTNFPTDVDRTKIRTPLTRYSNIVKGEESLGSLVVLEPRESREIIDATCQTNFKTDVEKSEKRTPLTRYSNAMKDNGSQGSLVVLEPEKSGEVTSGGVSKHTQTSQNGAIYSECHNEIPTMETECSTKNAAIVADVPGVCFVDESNLPRHVHMMCDIVPCSKQQVATIKGGSSSTRKTTRTKYTDAGKPTTNEVEEITTTNHVIPQKEKLFGKDSDEPSYSNGMDETSDKGGDTANLIGDVIGQVISERLFSSVDVESPRFSGSSSDDHKTNEEVVSESHVTETSNFLNCRESICVDEELVGDKILFRLQRQADFYENHIRNIDRILQQMKD